MLHYLPFVTEWCRLGAIGVSITWHGHVLGAWLATNFRTGGFF